MAILWNKVVKGWRGSSGGNVCLSYLLMSFLFNIFTRMCITADTNNVRGCYLEIKLCT